MNATYYRETRRKGAPVLVGDDGSIIHGTAAEVRDAKLYPCWRHALKDTIALARYLHGRGLTSREQMEATISARRREVIRFNAETSEGAISEALGVEIDAAARATGTTHDEYVRAALREAIARTRDEIGGELPYTRHERRALGLDDRPKTGRSGIRWPSRAEQSAREAIARKTKVEREVLERKAERCRCDPWELLADERTAADRPVRRLA